jgi:HD superfamily phosphodiesterase
LETVGRPDGTADKVREFIRVATPMVDLIIAGPFKEYTLHNRDHAKKLIHLAGEIIAEETLTQLSSLELLVIVYSAFLHDMGMAVTLKERDQFLKSR